MQLHPVLPADDLIQRYTIHLQANFPGHVHPVSHPENPYMQPENQLRSCLSHFSEMYLSLPDVRYASDKIRKNEESVWLFFLPYPLIFYQYLLKNRITSHSSFTHFSAKVIYLLKSCSSILEKCNIERRKKEYNELKCNRIAQSYILMCIFKTIL